MDTASGNVGGDDVQFYDCNGDTFYPAAAARGCESNENGAEIANRNYVTISDAENGSVSHGKVVGVDGLGFSTNQWRQRKNSLCQTW